MTKKITLLVAALGLAAAAVAGAQSTSTFTQMSGTISAIDASGNITVNTMAPGPLMEGPSMGLPGGYPCQQGQAGPGGCNGGGTVSSTPVTVAFSQVLVTNAIDQVVSDMSQMHVGDYVAVYEKSGAPYAVKDYTFPQVQKGGSGVGATGGVGVVPPPIPGGMGGTGTISASGYITVGASGDAVLQLQQKLQTLGYFPAGQAPTGYFGPLTATALKAYQSAQGLPSTGLFGPLTKQAMGF